MSRRRRLIVPGESSRALLARPRTFAAGVGMVIVAVLAMITIPTLTTAASDKLLADLDALGSDAWIVQPASQGGEVRLLPEGSLARASDLRGATEVLREVGSTLPVQLNKDDTRSHPVGVVGLSGTNGADALRTIAGLYRPIEGLHFATIGSDAARTLGLADFPATLIVGTLPVLVTGVLAGDPLLPELSTSVVMQADDILRIDPNVSSDKIVVRGSGLPDASAIGRGIDPLQLVPLRVEQPDALVAARQQSSGTLQTLGTAATLAAFGIAALGIAIMLTSAVRQRTAELAVRRVHGAPIRAIALLIASEGLIIGVFGGILGSAISLSVVEAVTEMRDWPYNFDAIPFLQAGGIAVILCLIASVPPAVVAVRVQPARAFAVE